MPNLTHNTIYKIGYYDNQQSPHLYINNGSVDLYFSHQLPSSVSEMTIVREDATGLMVFADETKPRFIAVVGAAATCSLVFANITEVV